MGVPHDHLGRPVLEKFCECPQIYPSHYECYWQMYGGCNGKCNLDLRLFEPSAMNPNLNGVGQKITHLSSASTAALKASIAAVWLMESLVPGGPDQMRPKEWSGFSALSIRLFALAAMKFV